MTTPNVATKRRFDPHAAFASVEALRIARHLEIKSLEALRELVTSWYGAKETLPPYATANELVDAIIKAATRVQEADTDPATPRETVLKLTNNVSALATFLAAFMDLGLQDWEFPEDCDPTMLWARIRRLQEMDLNS